MKTRKSFFTGLSIGLMFSFVVVGMTYSFSKKQSNPPTIQAVNHTTGVGSSYISLDAANGLISAYSSDFVGGNGLPGNTTIGGFISRSDLKSLSTSSEEAYVKYRVIMRSGENGEQTLGLALFPSSTTQNVLVTGDASSCPVLCDYPD